MHHLSSTGAYANIIFYFFSRDFHYRAPVMLDYLFSSASLSLCFISAVTFTRTYITVLSRIFSHIFGNYRYRRDISHSACRASL